MYIYLLAVDLFALAVLLLGFVGFAREGQSERLFPLILLVIGRSLALIVSLTEIDQSLKIIGTLEVFNTLCVVWALSGPTWHLSARWREFMGIGAAIAIFFTFLPLLPIWPIPPQIHSLIVAMVGAPLIFITHGEARWTHLAPPLVLGLANIFVLSGVTHVAWLFTLLAYAVFIGAVHWEGVQTYREAIQFFRERQLAAEALAQETTLQERERQRLLESREIISNVPSLNQSMEHIVQSMARITRADQSVIFMLDVKAMGLAHVMTVYSPERPFHITSRDEMVFELDDCPPLQKALEDRQQIFLPQQNKNGLHKLYSLWNEDRTGPTLIQPLTIQGRPVGALMLGNPVSRRPIPERDANLCRGLASQIAMMLEHRRRYLELELQAEAMAATVQQQLSTPTMRQAIGESTPESVDEIVSEPVAALEQEAVDETVPESVREVAQEPVGEPLPESAGQTVPQPLREPIPVQAGEIDEYLAVFEAIGDGVIVSDPMGRVQLVNKAAERILGRTRGELRGQPIGTIYGQIDSGESIENLAVAFSRRNQPLPTFIENEGQAIQGRLIPWRNEQREWMGIIGVFRDVTREVKADQARDDFVIAVSRELRARLTTVKGYAELITEGVIGEYSPEQLRIQRLILSSAEQMVEVLDNAIQIIAEDSRRTLAHFEEVDVTKIINEALREINPLAQVRELKLIREIRTELPPIVADRRHLRQILDNLLSNACRFTPKGGRVTLRAWTTPEPDNNLPYPHIILSVADNGVGIPKTELERIFSPFYQLENKELGEESGMGMGLAVVKESVGLHNGRVWVESTEGVGSIFQVALPISQEY